MATGQSDPRRVLALLWGAGERPRRGPKPALDAARVTAAAVEVVEADGVDGLSMRRVAARLGVGTASLYTYVAGKDELIALMIDTVIGSERLPHTRPGTWREKFADWARADWEAYVAHPWSIQLVTSRQLAGPNALAWLDSALQVLAEAGVPPRERLPALNAVNAYVRGHAREAIRDAAALRPIDDSGRSWQSEESEFLQRFVDFDRYPALVASLHEQPVPDARADFDFGLTALLDGIEARIRASPGG